MVGVLTAAGERRREVVSDKVLFMGLFVRAARLRAVEARILEPCDAGELGPVRRE